jgi:hypothetical protein
MRLRGQSGGGEGVTNKPEPELEECDCCIGDCECGDCEACLPVKKPGDPFPIKSPAKPPAGGKGRKPSA